MKTNNTLKIVAITILLSSSVWADTGSHENNPAEMPMMNEGNMSSMMDPQYTTGTDDRQMEHHQHHDMTMRDEESHGMMMEPDMRHKMMAMRHQQMHNNHHHTPMLGGENSGMMNPQMMQMGQQHMANMEQRLANIEALLAKLVEIQNP